MFEAFILAGGMSSRMGRDKASVEFEGETLIERTANTLKEAGATSVSVVLSKRSETVAPDALPVIRDEFQDAGALAGIHAALKACGSSITFVAACDLPFASADLAKLLIDALERSGADCAIPAQPDGRLQPLFGAYRRDPTLRAADRILVDTEASNAVANLTNRLRMRTMSFEEYSALANADRLLFNVNTPQELEQAARDTDCRI
ncbi:MAG: molybdenum cofactor guanylyltransferase [Acidobacteriota bacterium]|nr:MAG: molybdenum cofactor guanylyltransferase [Acidobacteriota bacterium]